VHEVFTFNFFSPTHSTHAETLIGVTYFFVSLVQGECLDCLDPEDRGSKLLRNLGNDIQLNRHCILEDLNLQTLQGLDTSNKYVAWRIATKKNRNKYE